MAEKKEEKRKCIRETFSEPCESECSVLFPFHITLHIAIIPVLFSTPHHHHYPSLHSHALWQTRAGLNREYLFFLSLSLFLHIYLTLHPVRSGIWCYLSTHTNMVQACFFVSFFPLRFQIANMKWSGAYDM